MHRCIYCGKEPQVVESGGLFYVRCCKKHNPFEYCGVRRTAAIESWDDANSLAAKVNMEHCREANRRSPYYYIVDGTRYETAVEAVKEIGCALKTLQGKFGKVTTTAIIRGYVVMRCMRAKRRVK